MAAARSLLVSPREGIFCAALRGWKETLIKFTISYVNTEQASDGESKAKVPISGDGNMLIIKWSG